MNSSNFPTDPQSWLVADASVAINLNATGRAAQILRALPSPLVVTVNAFDELKSGLYKGYRDAEHLQTLIDEGLVRLMRLGDGSMPIYESLIEGSDTLDDGEAATIAFAVEVSGAAIIDERKGRRICAERFSGLGVVSTAEVLMHDAVIAALGREDQIEAIVAALTQGRMHVPREQLGKIVDVLGVRAEHCLSLPKAVRIAS